MLFHAVVENITNEEQPMSFVLKHSPSGTDRIVATTRVVKLAFFDFLQAIPVKQQVGAKKG